MAMTLRLTDEQTTKLRAVADEEGRSMQQIAVAAVEEYTARHSRQRKIDTALDKILVDSADALRRLGEGA